ncbi:hypothetical protein [Ruminococcus sp.]|nr:hypothetical protein [Ruminococcus sp.]
MVELHGWLTICESYGDEDELTDDEHKSIKIISIRSSQSKTAV